MDVADPEPETLVFVVVVCFFNKFFLLPPLETFTGIEYVEAVEVVEVVEAVDCDVDTEVNPLDKTRWNQSVSFSAFVGLELP